MEFQVKIIVLIIIIIYFLGITPSAKLVKVWNLGWNGYKLSKLSKIFQNKTFKLSTWSYQVKMLSFPLEQLHAEFYTLFLVSKHDKFENYIPSIHILKQTTNFIKRMTLSSNSQKMSQKIFTHTPFFEWRRIELRFLISLIRHFFQNICSITLWNDKTSNLLQKLKINQACSSAKFI